MSIRKLPSKTEKLTKELADKFANMERGFCERHLSDVRVKNLIDEFTDGGGGIPFSWAIAICDGKQIRVDGQHTSYIFSNGLCEIPADAEVVLQHYICDTMGDVVNLWSFFNSRKSQRNKGDIVGAYVATDASLKELRRREANALTAGIELALSSEGEKWDDDCKLVIQNKEFALFFVAIMNSYNGPRSRQEVRRLIGRGPVVGAMFLTFRKDPAAALTFWSLVRDGLTPDPTSPDRMLHDYLLSTSIRFGRGSTRDDTTGDSRVAMMARCVTAWNAWRQGRKTQMLRYQHGRVPKAV